MMETSGLGTCQVCGAELELRRPQTRAASYCSNACRQRAYRKRMGSAVRAADLPAYPDSFVGRDKELSDLAPLLRKHRLLTILGPAGAGKTRLALELARQVRSNDVTLVELGRFTRPEQVVQAVAEATAVVEQRGVPLRETLVSALAGRKILLLVDNCEHLIDECCSLVDDLLSHCPALRVLTTSREALRAVGEVVYPLAGLSVERHARSEAVRLFVERARASTTAFAPGEGDYEQIASVCARLDGLPLAIELAARLVRPLPLDEIARHLDDRFELLNVGHRGAQQRHQSLRAAIAWSYDLLPPAEQVLFRRLSLLPGGFGLETAHVVCSDHDMIALLTNLEAKSLITRDSSGRFRMLESIRLYGCERLRENGEEAETFDRILRWLCDIGEPGVNTPILGPDEMRRQRQEQDNLAYVLSRMPDDGDERKLLLAAMQLRMRFDRGYVSEAGNTLLAVLESTSPQSRYRALACEYACLFALYQGRQDDALAIAREAVASATACGQTNILCRLYRALAGVHEVRGELTETVECLRRSIAHGSRTGSELSVAVARQNLAWILLAQGDVEAAAELLSAALPVVRTTARADVQAVVLHTAGCVALEAGELDAARSYFDEGLRIGSEAVRTFVDCVEGQGVIALRTGHGERGLRLLGAGERFRESAGFPREPWWQQRYEEAVTIGRATLSHARFAEADSAGRALDLDQAVEYALDDNWWQGSADPLLSARQRVIVGMVAQGLTNLQIAGRLNISHRTVETHIRNIKTVLDLSSRAQLAAWVTQQSN